MLKVKDSKLRDIGQQVSTDNQQDQEQNGNADSSPAPNVVRLLFSAFRARVYCSHQPYARSVHITFVAMRAESK